MSAEAAGRPLLEDDEPALNPWIITAAVMPGALMGALDRSIVNVALPYIRASLGVTVTEVAWVTTGYIMALAIIMPLTAWLASVFGRKRLYMVSLAVFTLFSFLCGASRTFSTLVIARVIQGAAAGVLAPTVMAILRESFPAEQQGMAMGFFGFVVMAGPAAGPPLGGWLTDNYNWFWIFWVNLPVGVIALWLAQQFVYDPPHARARRHEAGFDGLGILCLAMGLGSLQIVLEEGQTYDWYSSNLIIWLTVLTAAALSFFVWWELARASKPAVDLRILKNIPFATGTFISGILGLCLFATMFLLPLYMQDLLGYTAMKSGFAMLPRAAVMSLMLPIFGLMYNFLGPKAMISSGLVVVGAATFAMGRFTLGSSMADLIWPQIFQGAGIALIFVALSTAALATMPKPKMTAATGLYNLIRTIGGSVGTSIFATLLERAVQAEHARLVEHTSIFATPLRMARQRIEGGLMLRGMGPFHAKAAALQLLDGLVNQQGTMLAYEHVFMLSALLLFTCMPLVLLLKRPRFDKAKGGAPVSAD